MAGEALPCQQCYGWLLRGQRHAGEQTQPKKSDPTSSIYGHGITTILSFPRRFGAESQGLVTFTLRACRVAALVKPAGCAMVIELLPAERPVTCTVALLAGPTACTIASTS